MQVSGSNSGLHRHCLIPLTTKAFSAQLLCSRSIFGESLMALNFHNNSLKRKTFLHKADRSTWTISVCCWQLKWAGSTFAFLWPLIIGSASIEYRQNPRSPSHCAFHLSKLGYDGREPGPVYTDRRIQSLIHQ